MPRTSPCRVNLRAVLVLGCVVWLFLTNFGSRARAGGNTSTPAPSYTITTQGSTTTHRSEIDSWYGQVFIYVGGSFPAGTRMASFQYLFDLANGGNNIGYVTPLLFEYKPGEAFTIFTVRGIGKGFEVKLNSAPQAIPFDVIEGAKVTTNGNFTFGFINALVDSSGVPIATSLGAVDFGYPADSGPGAGGTETTNDWAASDSQSPTPVVALGATFGLSGANTDYIFFPPPYRTYSAQVSGIRAAQ